MLGFEVLESVNPSCLREDGEKNSRFGYAEETGGAIPANALLADDGITPLTADDGTTILLSD